ncbi:MAG: hypothetical protein KJ006_01965 [Thermoleophilia bacterium]|nr:hypothetical protein [Thermoleophilia bacterium]
MASDYTKVNLAADVPDVAAAMGVEGVSAHFAAQPLEAQQTGISLQRLEPGTRIPFGHRQNVQEEIYVVIAGGGRMRLDDEVIAVGALDAIRVAPAVIRNFEAGPDGMDLLAFGAPREAGEEATSDGEMFPGWWGDEDF